jgi:hypothetical protein
MEGTEEPEFPQKNAGDERLFLYPTRAIRRKNLGEFLLWSAVTEGDNLFAITRPPKNPLARPVYDNWVAFAKSLQLPVKFAVGEKWQGDFPSLLKSAQVLVTTSVAEGFGLAFLEPWLVMRPLVGRKIPEISDEFERVGVDLSALYDRVLIPIDWIGRDRFHQEVQITLTQAYESYGRTVRPDDVEQTVETTITNAHIDFGRLNEDLQQSFIEHIVSSPALKTEIIPSKLEPTGDQSNTIQHNYEIVRERFNLHEYGKRLLQIYQAVVESEVETSSEINADVLLDQFLAPERFWLLKS